MIIAVDTSLREKKIVKHGRPVLYFFVTKNSPSREYIRLDNRGVKSIIAKSRTYLDVVATTSRDLTFERICVFFGLISSGAVWMWLLSLQVNSIPSG